MSRLLVTQYQAEVEKIIRYGGSKKETSIRNAFERLLNDYCKPRNYLLVPELDFKTKFNTTVFPDGTIKDAIRLEHGWWESKDEYDKLDLEIEKKFEKGYPDENILFEDSQNAVLIQNSREVGRVAMRDADALDRLLNIFVDYERPEVRDFRAAITKFKEDIPSILEKLRDTIQVAEKENQQFRDRRNTFLEVCRQSINPEIEIFDVHEMLIQHILTEDIFTNIFHESQFHRENNIARELSAMIDTFFTGTTRRNTLKSIEYYYAVIRRSSENIANHHEKQKFLKALYENFYKAYNPKAADRLGIVYTPNEIVRFMIESADHLVHKHFGKLLSDEGVEILDPCTGTGTYVTELIEYLPAHKLEHKYKHEIHCNEMAILPYYIANLNIEFTYAQKMGQYEEFKNICLVDTLDHCGFEGKQFDLFAMSVQNTARIQNQNDRKISVIIGNPPYNAWQSNFNQDNANRPYTEIDKRLKATYVKNGTAQNKISVYDMYTRFYRWASDRVEEGIICFITNSSFLDSRAFDGFRKSIKDEFSYAYFIDCGGNVREISGRDGIFICEKHTIFGEAAMTGIVIGFLIKTKSKCNCQIFYSHPFDIHELREEKIKFISETAFHEVPFNHILPDKKNNWINQTENDFDNLLPLIDKGVKAGKSEEAVFKLFSAGVKTQRDEWIYDFSREVLTSKVNYLIDSYMERLNQGTTRDCDIKWDREVTKYLNRGIVKKYDVDSLVVSFYRPFTKKYFYFDRHFNGMTYQMFEVFPNGKTDNLSIFCTDVGTQSPFMVTATNRIPDLHLVGTAAQCLPLYRYDEKGDRIENITDWALEKFREHYSKTQARGLSPLFPTDNTQEKVRGLSPLLSADPSSEEARGLSPLFPATVEDRQLWFVTFVTHNSRISERMVTYGVQVGEPLIFTDEDQIFIAEKIAEASKRYEIAIAAFNVLPDHVHMVIDAETEKELNENIRKIKGFSSHEFQRLRNFDKGQNVWAQKFNRQPIQDEKALTDILEYVLNNHIKHSERWGQELISTWENGLPEKGLRSISEIVQNCINPPITRGLSPLPTANESEGTRGLSPLPEIETTVREITKLDIFHYTYAVLHHPAYCTKYELNLKREFPRLPFYENFHQWAAWGKALMDLHLNYETIEPFGLQRVEIAAKDNPKAKLKADKINGVIILDDNTQLIGVPAIAWEYKLGNRSALEWILDQYKEKKPKDPTIAKLFNTYKFSDYKEQVIDLLQRVCTVSVRTMEIIQQMSNISGELF